MKKLVKLRERWKHKPKNRETLSMFWAKRKRKKRILMETVVMNRNKDPLVKYKRLNQV